MMLSSLEKGISAGVMGYHRAKVLDTEVVRPGDRDIWPLYHVFSILVVKMSVPHCISSQSA
jgi:hypothetical protein